MPPGFFFALPLRRGFFSVSTWRLWRLSARFYSLVCSFMGSRFSPLLRPLWACPGISLPFPCCVASVVVPCALVSSVGAKLCPGHFRRLWGCCGAGTPGHIHAGEMSHATQAAGAMVAGSGTPRGFRAARRWAISPPVWLGLPGKVAEPCGKI